MNTLIIEDDLRLSCSIRDSFLKYKFSNRVDILHSYDEYLMKNTNIISYDIVLVDINLGCLNGKTGLDILEHIRKNHLHIPVIIISSYLEYAYLEKAFNIGAHDYINKPFRNRELQIRIERWFRNYVFSEYFSTTHELLYNGIRYDLCKYEFYIGKDRIFLSKGSKYLFSLFFINRTKLLRHEFLIEKLWGFTDVEHQKNLRIKIMRLKKQLAVYGLEECIKNHRGEGYIFDKSKN